MVELNHILKNKLAITNFLRDCIILRVNEVINLSNFNQIQSLRIQAGWTVEKNDFCECEPDSCEECDNYLYEDLFQLANRRFGLVIDLGWYPECDRNGGYKLVLIKDCNWIEPLEVFRSRNTKEIVVKIEYWTKYEFYSKYL